MPSSICKNKLILTLRDNLNGKLAAHTCAFENVSYFKNTKNLFYLLRRLSKQAEEDILSKNVIKETPLKN